MIPEDWGCVQLGTHSLKVGSGKTPTGGSIRYKNEGRPFVRSQNVGWGDLVLDDLIYIDDGTHAEFPATELHVGDVLLNITGASIGRPAMADERVAGGNVNQHVCIIRPNSDVLNGKFLCSFLLSSAGQSQIDSFQAGGNREGLNFKQVRAFQLPLPPTVTEQAAIAEALSDVDAAIAAQEAVIDKKRTLKVATMQALLSGTRRLPGFSGEWENKSLSTLCSMKSGFGITSKSLAGHGPYECFGGNGFRGFTGRYTHEGLFPLVGRVGALCGNVTLAEGQFFASEHAIVVTPNEKTSARWLAIVLRDLNLNRFSEASAQPVLVVSKLLLIGCFVPPDKDEQEAIALVATDIDADITRSVEKQRKLRQIKVGMMQQLLTGKIRLV